MKTENNQKINYSDVYIKQNGEFVSIVDNTEHFCEKWIKPVHPRDWNWFTRDFSKPANLPTAKEAAVIRDLVIRGLRNSGNQVVDLSNVENVDAIISYFDPESKHDKFNMEQFAYALGVELEHGRLKAVNVTNNHPFLTAMIVIAHLTESLSYYERLLIMENEAKVHEILRKLKTATIDKSDLLELLAETELELVEARRKLDKRLRILEELEPMEDID